MRSYSLLFVALFALACGTTPTSTTDGGSDDTDAGSSCPVGSGDRPSPRGAFAAGLDDVGGRLIVFGGDTGLDAECTPHPAFDGETWAFDLACRSWTKLQVDGPSPRARMATAVDTTNHRLLAFGGRASTAGSSAYTLYRETWAFDFATNTWTQLTTTGDAPPGVADASAIYRPGANAFVVFGGNSSTSGLTFTPHNDTWSLDLATNVWTHVDVSGARPVPREYAAAAYDADADRLVVYSGGDANAFLGPFLSDAWALDFSTRVWTNLNATGDVPANRIRGQLAADPARHRLLLFAGHDDQTLGERNDLDALDLTTNAWTTLHAGDVLNDAHTSGFCQFPADFTTPDLASPERRDAHFFAFDQALGVDIAFGGKTDCGDLNDVWQLDPSTGEWTNLSPAFSGTSCARSGKEDCTSLCL